MKQFMAVGDGIKFNNSSATFDINNKVALLLLKMRINSLEEIFWLNLRPKRYMLFNFYINKHYLIK
ncbi:hypothetical protein [Clostridium sp. M14]|uniref:hypothetical protein n=1 Tax=Clostridium sp. M14 TaxID=2716311 RepID=UPI0013EE6E9D|nr:hypothetical protein [Clostridium sp. M14]MBZ9693505.1 hypothetical protein [Clostridium sp. M14]